MTTPTLTRWRLLLGDQQDEQMPSLAGDQVKMDRALEALYDSERKGGLGASAPKISRWLGDIRNFFPQSVVKVMQQDAIERLNLKQLLLEKEMLASVEPDVYLVATLMSLRGALPDSALEAARTLVQRLVDQLMERLQAPTSQAIRGAIHRTTTVRNPRNHAINWNKTILKNLRHYQPEHKTVIPETLYGFGNRRRNLKDIVLCIDQSGSMGDSVIYSGILGAVIASLPAVSTRMVVFDTAVADLTEALSDPVSMLLGIQLGGGTDIAQALGYCQQIIPRPSDTIMVLITDLYEGGNAAEMIRRAQEIVASGVQLIVLLALNDEGAPGYDHHHAKTFSNLGVPVFACTPDLFPEMMAAAIQKMDLHQWAAAQGIAVK